MSGYTGRGHGWDKGSIPREGIPHVTGLSREANPMGKPKSASSLRGQAPGWGQRGPHRLLCNGICELPRGIQPLPPPAPQHIPRSPPGPAASIHLAAAGSRLLSPYIEALCAGNRWDLMTRLCPAGSSNPFPARRDRTGDQDMAMGKGTQREPPAKLSPSGATGQGEPMDPIGQELR